MDNRYNHNRRKYSLKAHIVLVTKYRKQLLKGSIADDVKQKIFDIANTRGYEIIAMETDKDHVHFLIDYKSGLMARDSQGSSHHLKVVGGAYGKRKDLIYEKKENEGAVAPVSSISPLWRTVYHTALYCLSKKQHKDYRLRQGTGHL